MSNHNSSEAWNKIWTNEGTDTWRASALDAIYSRICHIVGTGNKKIIDLGGGVGVLANRLKEQGHTVEVWEHNDAAICACLAQGLQVHGANLEEAYSNICAEVVVSTEVLEHLSEDALHTLLRNVKANTVDVGGSAFFSVPNNRLSPEEEPQHKSIWTAKQFLDLLRNYFEHVRVEVLGPPAGDSKLQPAYLLAVCGKVAKKNFRLSFTMPVRDEAYPYPRETGQCTDIERTLASFRGVADEIIIGVDPRSSDDTYKIATQYADVVFELESPQGPPEDQAKSVHFAWVRNQCIKRCTGDWIFMSEGHESLKEGQDALLHLDQVPAAVKGLYVLRTGEGSQWGFPWLTRQGVSYKRSTHNLPMMDGKEMHEAYTLAFPQVKTDHRRVEKNSIERAKQRKIQNRITLLQDWSVNKNSNSLHYLGTEWRGYNDEKAIQYLREYVNLEAAHNGAMRYQTRLALAKLLATTNRFKEAKEVLVAACGDDWSRTDHFVWLGDIAFEQDLYDEALQWYLRGATRVGDPPFTIWWIDTAFYSYIPCQRLAMVYATLGSYEKALQWAELVVEQLPEDAPEEMLKEAIGNVEKLLEITGEPKEAVVECE